MFSAALIERHPLLRLGLLRVLRSIDDIGEVVSYDPGSFEADSPHPAQVNILLFSQSPDLGADRALLTRLSEWMPPHHILLLQEQPGAPIIAHPALDGCIQKTASPELISAAVKLVLAGGKCFPAGHECSARAAGGIQSRPSPLPSPSMLDRPQPLAVVSGARALNITPRQFEILVFLARGLSLKKVSQALNISVATVKSHASGMYRRLNVQNKQQAIHEVLQRGVNLHEPIGPQSGSRQDWSD